MAGSKYVQNESQNDLNTKVAVMKIEKGDGNREVRFFFCLLLQPPTLSAPVLDAVKSAKLILKQTLIQPPLLPYRLFG